jgi:hypothetical protein
VVVVDLFVEVLLLGLVGVFGMREHVSRKGNALFDRVACEESQGLVLEIE